MDPEKEELQGFERGVGGGGWSESERRRFRSACGVAAPGKKGYLKGLN